MELTYSGTQTIQPGGVAVFNEVAVKPCCCMNYREGSGIATLKGMTNTDDADYEVKFGGNIALADGSTVGPISMAIAVTGEPIASTTVVSTPAAVGEFNNVHTFITLDVPRGCCYNVSVENTSTVPIDLSNARFAVNRLRQGV